MGDFNENFRESQRSAETAAQFGMLLWVGAFLLAIAVAVWMFRDAGARGKSGVAAALIAFLSAFYGIPFTLIVLCAWILFRPEITRRDTADSEDNLPEKLPSGIVAATSTEEFLEELEEST